MASVYISCIISFSAACFGTYISRLNYPGGLALSHVNSLNPASVHIDAFNAGSGVSLFHHVDGTRYSKEEGLDVDSELMFEYLVREWSEEWDRGMWDLEVVVDGYDGVRIKKVGEVLKCFISGDFGILSLLPVEVKTAPKSMILRRK